MIFKKPLIFEILILSIIVATLHKIALSLYLYWTTDWFDLLMHTLGGLLIGLIGIYLFYRSGIFHFSGDKIWSIFFVTVFFVLVVGLSWELWEIFVGFTNVLNDQTDTIIDVLMDTLGAIISVVYFYKKELKINE